MIVDWTNSGFTGTVTTIPNWGSAPNVSTLTLEINAPSGLANWNPPQSAVVEHFDPTVGAVVTEHFLIGGSYGPTRITITTGSLSPGSYAGEIQVIVVDQDLLQGLLPGTKHIGPIGKLLQKYGGVNSVIDGLAGSSAYTVIVLDKKVVAIELGVSYSPGFLSSLGISAARLPPGLKAELDASGNLIGFSVIDKCFLAGTPVTMADGSSTPIEQVRAGDWVMSFDQKTGETKPGRVKRTMQNRAKIVLDFHGTFVTPGHVYWCAGGTFAGRFAPLIDILRDDGVIQHEDGTLIRASTGCAVGSPDDERFWAFLTREHADGDRIIDKRQLRLGMRWMLPDGRHFTMRDYMAGLGIEPQADGSMRWTRKGITAPFIWALSDSLPNPEDFVLARSRITLADIWRAGEWEGMQPNMPAPLARDGGPVQGLSAIRLAGMKRNQPVAMAGGAASSVLLPGRTLNRHQRKAEEATRRKLLQAKARFH